MCPRKLRVCSSSDTRGRQHRERFPRLKMVSHHRSCARTVGAPAARCNHGHTGNKRDRAGVHFRIRDNNRVDARGGTWQLYFRIQHEVRSIDSTNTVQTILCPLPSSSSRLVVGAVSLRSCSILHSSQRWASSARASAASFHLSHASVTGTPLKYRHLTPAGSSNVYFDSALRIPRGGRPISGWCASLEKRRLDATQIIVPSNSKASE